MAVDVVTARTDANINGQTVVPKLAIFNNELYGGTFGGSRLFKWNEIDNWTQVAGQSGTMVGIDGLTQFGSNLYGAGAFGSRLLRWNGADAWVEVAAAIPAYERLLDLIVFNGKLYGCGGTDVASTGVLVEWNGVDAWENKSSGGAPVYLQTMVEFNGKLYAGSGGSAGNGGHLYEWDGNNTLNQVAAPFNAQNQIRRMVVWNNRLYAGTYPNAMLFRWDGVNSWETVATQALGETYMTALIVGADGIYGGTSPTGYLLKWDDTATTWETIANAATDLGLAAIEIWDFADFKDVIYGSTSVRAYLVEFPLSYIPPPPKPNSRVDIIAEPSEGNAPLMVRFSSVLS